MVVSTLLTLLLPNKSTLLLADSWQSTLTTNLLSLGTLLGVPSLLWLLSILLKLKETSKSTLSVHLVLETKSSLVRTSFLLLLISSLRSPPPFNPPPLCNFFRVLRSRTPSNLETHQPRRHCPSPPPRRSWLLPRCHRELVQRCLLGRLQQYLWRRSQLC
jgi:hypothetical protein